jgi:hypothetical protein
VHPGLPSRWPWAAENEKEIRPRPGDWSGEIAGVLQQDHSTKSFECTRALIWVNGVSHFGRRTVRQSAHAVKMPHVFSTALPPHRATRLPRVAANAFTSFAAADTRQKQHLEGMHD